MLHLCSKESRWISSAWPRRRTLTAQLCHTGLDPASTKPDVSSTWYRPRKLSLVIRILSNVNQPAGTFLRRYRATSFRCTSCKMKQRVLPSNQQLLTISFLLGTAGSRELMDLPSETPSTALTTWQIDSSSFSRLAQVPASTLSDGLTRCAVPRVYASWN